MQLARAVRNRTTGVLYVLDEPSIGLHPVNIVGLTGVMDDLIADGNSVILVDHDTQILSHADWLIEMGPEAGAKGGQVIAEGTISDIVENKVSRIGAFLKPEYAKRLRPVIQENDLFEHGAISLSIGAIHTVKPLKVKIPKGHSYSGKPCSRHRGSYCKNASAFPCPFCGPGRYFPGKTDRCNSYWHQCPLHCCYLCQCPR